MRDYLENLSAFNLSVEKSVKSMVTLSDQNLISSVLDNSNFHWDSEYFFNLYNLSIEEFIRLGILCWYLPNEVSVILRMDLEKYINKFGSENKILLSQFLNSKAEMLIFLQETSLWHTRDLFGNILSKQFKLDKFLKVNYRIRRVKENQRKRGYQDHGSRVPDHKKKPKFDWSLTEKQNQIEDRRIIREDTIQLLKGWFS